jgi:hypothetical protein
MHVPRELKELHALTDKQQRQGAVLFRVKPQHGARALIQVAGEILWIYAAHCCNNKNDGTNVIIIITLCGLHASIKMYYLTKL